MRNCHEKRTQTRSAGHRQTSAVSGSRSHPSEGLAWIDRRLVRKGFLSGLCTPESLLYFFLALIGERDGLFFWDDAKLARALKFNPASLEQVRRGLGRKDLVLCRTPRLRIRLHGDRCPVRRLTNSALEAEINLRGRK